MSSLALLFALWVVVPCLALNQLHNTTIAITKTKKHLGPCASTSVRLPTYQFLFNAWRRLRQRPRSNSDCDTLFRLGNTSDGVYTLRVGENDIVVYCDFDNNGRNYVVIQRRSGPALDFDQNYKVYQNGFGSLNGDFWLGLNAIHHLSHHLTRPVLRIELTDAGGSTFAEYRFFRVLSAVRNYVLRVGGYRGNAELCTLTDLATVTLPAWMEKLGKMNYPNKTNCNGDGMLYHNFSPFSARDYDNDRERWDRNCAEMYGGGWWYNDCFAVNLNSRYAGTAANMDAITWYYWRQNFNPLTATIMSLRNGD